MYKNRYATHDGHQYDGVGEFKSPREALHAATMALRDALPGTRWVGCQPWGTEVRHAAQAV